MMVNPVVAGYTKTLNHQKILRKTQKKLLKTKNISKPKYTLSWGIGVARGGRKGPCPPKMFGKYSHFVF